jgi:hypothetical protein
MVIQWVLSIDFLLKGISLAPYQIRRNPRSGILVNLNWDFKGRVPPFGRGQGDRVPLINMIEILYKRYSTCIFYRFVVYLKYHTKNTA